MAFSLSLDNDVNVEEYLICGCVAAKADAGTPYLMEATRPENIFFHAYRRSAWFDPEQTYAVRPREARKENRDAVELIVRDREIFPQQPSILRSLPDVPRRSNAHHPC
jgi:hypothetical protein